MVHELGQMLNLNPAAVKSAFDGFDQELLWHYLAARPADHPPEKIVADSKNFEKHFWLAGSIVSGLVVSGGVYFLSMLSKPEITKNGDLTAFFAMLLGSIGCTVSLMFYASVDGEINAASAANGNHVIDFRRKLHQFVIDANAARGIDISQMPSIIVPGETLALPTIQTSPEEMSPFAQAIVDAYQNAKDQEFDPDYARMLGDEAYRKGSIGLPGNESWIDSLINIFSRAKAPVSAHNESIKQANRAIAAIRAGKSLPTEQYASSAPTPNPDNDNNISDMVDDSQRHLEKN
jgi:hypothetical protein